MGNSSNLTSPCVTSKPAQYNVSDPSFSQSAYDLVVFPTSGGNDPNGISFGLTYEATPLAVSTHIWEARDLPKVSQMTGTLTEPTPVSSQSGSSTFHFLPIRKVWQSKYLIRSSRATRQQEIASMEQIFHTSAISPLCNTFQILPSSMCLRTCISRIFQRMLVSHGFFLICYAFLVLFDLLCWRIA